MFSIIILRRASDTAKPLPREFAALASRKRGPFAHILELRDLPEMTPDMFAALEPFVTIFGASGGIDPRLADERLIAALPDVSKPMATELRSLHAMTNEDAARKLADLGPIARHFDVARHPVTRFEIETRNTAGRIRRYEIVTTHYADDTKPFRILDWRELG